MVGRTTVVTRGAGLQPRGRGTDNQPRRGIVQAAVVLAWMALAVSAAAQATLSPDLVELLRSVKATDTDKLAVSEEDGRFLRLMAASSHAKRALEIGGAQGYKRFFDLVMPRPLPRGLFLAHTVVNKEAEMRDFLDAITKNPGLFTTIVTPSGEGMSVSYKLP